MNSRAYILFTRIPTPYKTKTRLMKRLSPVEASDVQEVMLQDLVLKLETLPAFGVDIFIAYSDEQTPDAFLAQLPRQYQTFAQQGTTLGKRMKHAMDFVFQQGYQQVVLTGSDIPQLTATLILTAFQQLEEVVIGPSIDGGYYLIGGTAQIDLEPIFLSDVYWGADQVLTQTLNLLGRQRKVAVLPALLDVDEPADLQKIAHEVNQTSPSLNNWLKKNRGKYDEKSYS